MWKQFVKDYLSFTKRDRVGVIVLLVLIFIVVLLPYIWPVKKIPPPPKEEIEKLKLQVAQLNRTGNAFAAAGTEDTDFSASDYPAKKNFIPGKAIPFYFDPNTLTAAGWKRLGIRDKTAATIQNYLARGGRFRKPEDIGKIYGLFKDDYERLLPYVKIAVEEGLDNKNNNAGKPHQPSDRQSVYLAKHFSPAIIDINMADSTALVALPGIGSKLAARIIHFRDKLGGFNTVQQVAETYGLPDSTFHKIKDLLQCNYPVLQQININTADAGKLKQHPYIHWNLANIIVQYRAQHGNFKSVDDLRQIEILTPEIFAKIKPYLVIQ